MTDSATTFADGLRVAADLLETYPDLPPAYVTAVQAIDGARGIEVTWQLMLVADDTQRETAARIIRTIGGVWDKDASYDTFRTTRTHRGIRLRITADREQVCERRVTGTETVTVPAVEAQPERVEERELVEWDCSAVLAEAVTS